MLNSRPDHTVWWNTWLITGTTLCNCITIRTIRCSMVRRRFLIWPSVRPNLACLRSVSPTMQHAWRLRDVHQLRANGVKPIIGIEAYVTPETARQDKSRVHWGTEAQRRDDVSGGGLITHLTMWAENDEGLVNLIKASSVANLEGRVMRYPRMDKEVLATYSKGVIASSGCPSGIIQTRLRLGQFDEALRAAGEFQDIFGKDNFFIELMDHGLPIETQVTGDLLTIAKKLNAPLLATNDSHYVHAEDAQAQDAMLCINSGSRLDDPDRFKFDGTGYYIKTAEEMRELFKDHPDACDNTLAIAERCNVMFDDHEDGAFMPKFPCPEGWDETSLFLKKVEEGLEKRYDGNPPLDVLKQADYECGVICQMQFCGYFLVVADYIQWAKDHGIMVGPGRGSAAGAMVAYSMGITELDPLKHGLIFERFLNPERVSLPDIDVDFDPEGRARVIEYCGEKYGTDKVAQCVIYGTIKTKQALKDSARIMGYEFSVGEKITKALPPAATGGKDISCMTSSTLPPNVMPRPGNSENSTIPTRTPSASPKKPRVSKADPTDRCTCLRHHHG